MQGPTKHGSLLRTQGGEYEDGADHIQGVGREEFFVLRDVCHERMAALLVVVRGFLFDDTGVGMGDEEDPKCVCV